MSEQFSMRHSRFKAAVSAFALALFLFVHLLAASSALHHAIHDHAERKDHQCAATLLSDGQVEISDATSAIVEKFSAIRGAAIPDAPFISSAHSSLFSGRGPPV